MRSVEEQNGHWLLKNQFGPRTEKTRLDRIMSYAGQAKPLLNAYRRALVASWAIFAAVAVCCVAPLGLGAKALGGVIVGVVGGLLTHVAIKTYEDSRSK